MITVDIVSPVGGAYGGIENVIRYWTQYIDGEEFTLRVFHMHKGMAYLSGYDKAYCIDKEFDVVNYDYCVETYKLFIQSYGAPDVCIAANWPLISKVCAQVKRENCLDMQVVSWVHSEIEEYRKQNLGGVEELLYADAHFAITKKIADDIQKNSPSAKIYTIWNPVSAANICFSDTRGGNTLAYVGRLSEMKRIDIILEAMYRAKADWKLRIIGDGEIKNDITQWISLLELDEKTELLGWKDNPWEYCTDVSAIVMASEYEGFGLVAVEALMSGMPVISTKAGIMPDIIESGRNGYLYEQENAQQLADILDGIASGELSFGSTYECRDSVSCFEIENYFRNVKEILRCIYEHR